MEIEGVDVEDGVDVADFEEADKRIMTRILQGTRKRR